MPKIGPYRIRLRWLFLALVVGGPLEYYQYNWRAKNFYKEYRKFENEKLIKLVQTSQTFTEIQSNIQYQDINTQKYMNLNSLPEMYKVIYFGQEINNFLQIKEFIEKKIGAQDLGYYCIINKEEKDLIEKIKITPEKFFTQKMHFFIDQQNQKRKEIYLLNEENDVIFHDPLKIDPKDQKDFNNKIAILMKLKITKDIEKKFVNQMKF